MVNETLTDIGFNNYFRNVGDWFSNLTTDIIKYIASYGYNITNNQGKILTILILSMLTFFVIKVMERPLKWFIGALFIILMISVLVSLFS